MTARRAWGLRFRITASFALGALGMAVVLSLLTYGLTRRSLIHARESTDVSQAVGHAFQVLGQLSEPQPDVVATLSSLGNPATTHVLLNQGDRWYSNGVGVQESSLPAELVATVGSGHRSASMIFKTRRSLRLAVGVPITAIGAGYYELFDLEDLNRTLATLALSLAAASVVTAAAGLAVGRWASRRVLFPVTETARAAAAIAGGRLDTRLPEGDPELAELASSFNAMVSALQRRIERDARFASDVSHELRSPLTTLANAVEVLSRRRGEMTQRSAQALDLLSGEVHRFQHLVEDLLEVSRFDAAASDLALEEVRPAELVRQAMAALGSTVPLEVEPRAETMVVSADKRRLERVMANLLTNADVHAGGAVRVGVAATPVGVRITVDDAGPGVPPDQREAIFERFARASPSRSRSRGEGVGLGLSLVAEHVRLHGGDVWVEDSPEGGARFAVEIPFDGPAQPRPAPATRRRSPGQASPPRASEDPTGARLHARRLRSAKRSGPADNMLSPQPEDKP